MQTEKLASLGQLTAGIAHEIKNPLNFVNNFSALSAELIDEMNDVLETRRARRQDARRSRRIDAAAQGQSRKGRAARQARRLHRQEHAAAFARGLRRAAAGRHQCAGRREPQSRLSRRARRESRSSISRCSATSIPTPARSRCSRRKSPARLLNLISNGFYAATKRKTENGEPDFEPMLQAATQKSRRPRRDPHPRQRHRHPARGEGEDVQSVLHDQAGGRRHRAWAFDEPRHHRETTRRQDRGRDRARRNLPNSRSCCREQSTSRLQRKDKT